MSMNRRQLIALLGSTAAVSWPGVARAQQGERVRRIGVLTTLSEDDPVSRTRAVAFEQGLREFGWIDGRNVRIDYRWAAGDAARFRQYATELVALAPDVILAAASPSLAALQQVSRTVPIIFVQVIDPVGGGFVNSLARPGGNATGFALYEYGISGKWLEVLKEIAPKVTRAAVLRDATLTSGTGQFAAIQSVAPSVGVEVSPINARDAEEIERAVSTFARSPNGGLIVTASPPAVVHRELIFSLAARHRLPAVYWQRFYVTAGGLIAYGPDPLDQYRRAASPADLPVQAPTKYELIVNLKTASALGLNVPPMLLARADEVIE
jgi:putative ABC transport system substrate-binding protein